MRWLWHLLAVLAVAAGLAGPPPAAAPMRPRPAPSATAGTARPGGMGVCCAGPAVRLAYAIMPLGDSITAGLASTDGSGYRSHLDAMLPPGHVWLGSQRDALGFYHEGHPGWTIDQLAVQARAWTALARPTYVLLDAGTNDDGQGRTSAQMLASMGHLLDEVFAGGAVVVVLAKITITPYNTAEQQQQEIDFNAGLPALAGRYGGRVLVVDMSQPGDVEISADQVHPDDTGYERMARIWRAALPG